MVIIKVLAILLLADFITGLVHWFEDSYGDPKWKFMSIGKRIIIPNIEHHKYPRKFLNSSVWERIRLSVFSAIFIGVLLLFTGVMNYYVLLFLVLSSMANELHAISHKTDKENGKIIVWIQKLGIVQSRKMHGWHHKAPYDCNYCVMTNYLNPILNRLNFWYRLEKLLLKLFDIKTIRGASDRNFV